jgi:hypothetical protein
MIAHCGSRLGVISYIYKNRHDIAQSLGFIKEKPIALCNSNYFSGEDLSIQDHLDEESLPLSILVPLEINLFCSTVDILSFDLLPVELSISNSRHLSRAYAAYPSSVFHPPGLIA